MKRNSIPFRIEEIPIVCAMILASLKLRAEEFERYSPKFNAAFIIDYENKIIVVEGRTHTMRIVGELKQITANLYEKVDTTLGLIRKLEGYLIRAKGLTIPVENFKFKELREKIKGKELEGYVDIMRLVTENLTGTNLDAVKAEGFKDADKTALVTLTEEVNDENLLQNEKMNEMIRVAKDNQAIIIELYEIAANVMDAGKRIFFDTDKEAVKEFTAAQIKKRIRQEQPKKKEEEPVTETGMLTGKMTDKGTGAALEEGTVQVEGTLLVEMTDAEGDFQIDGVKVGEVKVKGIMDGYVILLKENIVIKKDEATNLDFEMEPLPGE
jgi:hypothetical protein